MASIFRSFFARLWALWGLVSFVGTFFIIFPIACIKYFFKDPLKSQRYFNHVSRLWMHVWLRMIGCFPSIKGLSHFESPENFIIAYNHRSMLDIPLSSPFTPGPNKTIGKSSFAKVPIFGLFYKMGTILIDRKDENSRKKSYEQMVLNLRLGINVCIYPEGTRNRSKQPLKPFYDGAFKLSLDSGKSIIPCVIKGTDSALPVGQFLYLYPRKLEMIFLDPIAPEGKSVQEIKHLVTQSMLNELTQHTKDQKS